MIAIVCLKLEDKVWYATKLLIGYLELIVCIENKLVWNSSR